MTVKGDLRDMDLTSIVAVNCNQMNQARLVIRHEDREASIFFHDGNIVHMSLDSLEGDEVMYEVLGWEDGTFELERNIPTLKRTVNVGWSELLLQGMQRLDEGGALGGGQGGERAWESLVADGESKMNLTAEGRDKDVETAEDDMNEDPNGQAVEGAEAEASDLAKVAEHVEGLEHLEVLAKALFRMGLDSGLSPDQAVLQASATSLPPFVADEGRREFKDLLVEAYRESLDEQLNEQAEELRERMMLEEDEAS